VLFLDRAPGAPLPEDREPGERESVEMEPEDIPFE
jgi:hypothetical protein